jgi:hypothetical protein
MRANGIPISYAETEAFIAQTGGQYCKIYASISVHSAYRAAEALVVGPSIYLARGTVRRMGRALAKPIIFPRIESTRNCRDTCLLARPSAYKAEDEGRSVPLRAPVHIAGIAVTS